MSGQRFAGHASLLSQRSPAATYWKMQGLKILIPAWDWMFTWNELEDLSTNSGTRLSYQKDHNIVKSLSGSFKRSPNHSPNSISPLVGSGCCCWYLKKQSAYIPKLIKGWENGVGEVKREYYGYTIRKWGLSFWRMCMYNGVNTE